MMSGVLPESSPPMKHKVSAVVAVVLLAASVGVVAWIVAARPHSRPEVDGPPKAAVTSSAGRSPQPSDAPSPGFPVPKKIVDPLKGDSYCATARLLGVFAHQPYGLDAKLGLVAGQVFDRRMSVVARTYAQLAEQGTRRAHVGAQAVAAWKALAASADETEKKLRVTGLDVHSEVMIVQLAAFAKTTKHRLPKATSTMSKACGFTAAAVGILP